MNDITPSYDVDTEYFREMLDAADSLDATLAVTSKGRLIIYGLRGNAVEVAESQPFSTFYVEALDENTLGFTF